MTNPFDLAEEVLAATRKYTEYLRTELDNANAEIRYLIEMKDLVEQERDARHSPEEWNELTLQLGAALANCASTEELWAREIGKVNAFLAEKNLTETFREWRKEREEDSNG